MLISLGWFFAFGSTWTYSRVVWFALSRCSLVIFVVHKVNIIQWYNLQALLGSTKTKQASHMLQYITHLHQQWSIHNSVSKMCIQNIANSFMGFWFRACWILREIREYNRFYSTSPFVWHKDATFQEISDRIKNFRKYETVSLHKNNWSKRGKWVWKKRIMYQNSLIQNQIGNLFHNLVFSHIF